jgi:hypothetical protein
MRLFLVGMLWLSLVACARKPVAGDAPKVLAVLTAVAQASDRTAVSRLVYRDEGQRAAIIASCSADYRKRRDAGEKLSPDAWVLRSFGAFVDGVAAVAKEEHRTAIQQLRKTTGL